MLPKKYYDYMKYIVLFSLVLLSISLSIYVFSDYTTDGMKSIPMWIASAVFMVAYEIFLHQDLVCM